ncbi:hypothetical protein GUITHDRAFT_101937 [Guillardia theta CCMP2712]|uniref:Uncharacterized protein n=1 Tax=Guillardia theta (strain CCMP2712) TaxID=905079 RepID=L1JVA6_GUITC|nr:hypothetical protein GUITHDRAFT_101937 [Guillardia theta CCMP2712]EKX52028.1 hypothetical protein GUITHDRAFT_101937 [Guillardia theta CCMP2712]|eukprot:XP_005839008.1 hypothetical protein GUITHDRAFT_101937 [Guillardia theta CCMP2712]
MFELLNSTKGYYGNDHFASIYATQMHSDSGYLVTNGKSGSGTYAGYLTWDDHPQLAKKVVDHAVDKTLGGCKPFGCISGVE